MASANVSSPLPWSDESNVVEEEEIPAEAQSPFSINHELNAIIRLWYVKKKKLKMRKLLEMTTPLLVCFPFGGYLFMIKYKY